VKYGMDITRTERAKMRYCIAYLLSVMLLVCLLSGTARSAAVRFDSRDEIPKNAPVAITADKLDYDRTTDIYTAVGHVKIEYGSIRLEADTVTLNNKTGEATAEGKVLLQDKEDMTRADKLQININTRSGIMYKGDLFKKKENIHMKGDVIERRSETVYHVENGLITTCDEDEWYLKANELNVDMNRYATARGVSFNLLGLPMFYTPYFLIPVKRQTGFLLPTVGNSSLDGLSIQNSFFWAISDYQDMTLSSDYRAKTGHGSGLEYRYMNSIDSSGQVFGKFWNMFRGRDIRNSLYKHDTDESRWELRLKHKEEITEDLSARADINLVSDEHYYHDLDKQLDVKSKPYLDSNIFFVERWNAAALSLLGQYSTDLTQSNRITIQKLPEIRYTVFAEPIAGPVHFYFDSSWANFTRQEGNGVRRMDLSPGLAAVFGSSGLSLTPRAGGRATFYDRKGADATLSESTARFYGYAGLDVNARISRVFGKDGEEGIGKIRHSIEPTISYIYIPEFKQEQVPQFDTLDSISSMNTVTISVINRVTVHYKESKEAAGFKTFDLAVLKLSQGYNLGATNTNHPSILQGDLFINAPKFFSVSASSSYDPETGHVSHSETAGLTVGKFKMNVSYQNLRKFLTTGEYLIVGGALQLGKWNLAANYSQDLLSKITNQVEYRLKYEAQCWGINAAFVHSPGESRFTVMLDLKGMGGGFGK